MNAVLDASGYFVGGCNCACNPYVSCPAPYVLNYDPVTQSGNCACYAPINTAPTTTTTTKAPHTNTFTPPTPNAPNTAVVTCSGPEPCQCPTGHQGPCIITLSVQCAQQNPTCTQTIQHVHTTEKKNSCDGVDACVEQTINCNNNGFDCTVDCVSETACEGATVINGPMDGSLTVNCIGEFSCEGGTTFNGLFGKDLQVSCQGPVSCAEGVFFFGYGRGVISCTGDPESCQGASLNLYPNTPISCMGAFCPPDIPQTAQTPFSCDGGADACKDGIIECNNPGFPCTVTCTAEEACSGGASVVGPTGSSLTVHCNGAKACEGEVGFNGQSGTDMTVICNGMEACKGNPVFKYGNGVGRLECNGQPDACNGGAQFFLLANAEITPGMAFECIGSGCPPSTPQAFNNVQGYLPPVQAPNGPVVVHPSPSPPVATQPQYPSYPSGANFCCVTSLPNFQQWQGTCWLWTNEVGCLGEQGRCRWDITQCLPSPPTCMMAYDACAAATDCCSKMCVFAAPGEGICV